MKKLILILALFAGTFAQAQTERCGSTTMDSIIDNTIINQLLQPVVSVLEDGSHSYVFNCDSIGGAGRGIYATPYYVSTHGGTVLSGGSATGHAYISSGTWSAEPSVYTTSHTPTYAGERWLSEVSGDTTNCIYDGARVDTISGPDINWGCTTVDSYSGSPTINAYYHWETSRRCFVHVEISGTSNSDSLVFYLPYVAKNSALKIFTSAINNGSATSCTVNTNANSKRCTVGQSQTNNLVGWTATGTKSLVIAEFEYYVK